MLKRARSLQQLLHHRQVISPETLEKCPVPECRRWSRRSMGGFSGGYNAMNYPKLAVREKEMRVIHRVATTVFQKESLSKSQFHTMCRKLGFRDGDLGLFLKKFGLIFEVTRADPTRFMKLTDIMKELMEREKEAMKEHEPAVVTTIRKLLMLSKDGKLPVKKLLLLKRTFGFPEDFDRTILPKYPSFFEVVRDDWGDQTLELRLWDPALAVTARETLRKHFSTNEVDTFCEGGPFSFRVPFERHCRMKENVHRMLVKMQKRPFLPPYDHSQTDREQTPKRNLALCHEFLSLTVLKRCVLRDLLIFKEEFLLPEDLAKFLEEHCQVFFAHASLGKHVYMFLREAYHADYVVERTPYIKMWRKYVELALISRKRRPLKKSLLLPDDPRRDRRAPDPEEVEEPEDEEETLSTEMC